MKSPRREPPRPWPSEYRVREAMRLLGRFPRYVAAVRQETAWQYPRRRRIR